jgi:hypothetical protein
MPARNHENEFRQVHSHSTIDDIDAVAVAPHAPSRLQFIQSDTRLTLAPPQYQEKQEDTSNSSRVKPKSFCCGCFQTRQTCLTVWLVIFLVFGIAIAIAGYVAMPRIPNITVDTPYQPANLTSPQFERFENGTLRNVTIHAAVNFTVDSKNFYDYFVSEINVKVVREKLISGKSFE